MTIAGRLDNIDVVCGRAASPHQGAYVVVEVGR